MKRWIGSLALTVVAGVAVAQAPFTIIRPLDNSRHKEKISVRFPANSIPTNGYVGIFLNGQLLEALKPTYVVPRQNGKVAGRPYYEYVLDVKGRGLKDTEPGQWEEITAVLYDEYGETPRVVDRSTVRVRFDRAANINYPSNGQFLRYGWKPGQELIYQVTQRQVVSTISESQNRAGGRPAELPSEGEPIRMLYAVDSMQGKDALVRMQPLPIKGKNYADLTVSGDSSQKRYYDYEMAPIYMLLSPTGVQKWGAIPPYIQFEGTSGEASRLDLFASFPLPTLPDKKVRPGDSWASRFQTGIIDLNKLHDVTSVVRSIPARGEFVGIEWERGRPCVKLKNSIAAGARSLEGANLARAGAAFQNDVKYSVDETVWFDLSSGKVIKIIRDQTIDAKADSAAASALGFGFGAGAGGGAAQGGGGVGPGRPGAGGAPALGGPSGGPAGPSRGGFGGDEDRGMSGGSQNLRQGGRPGGIGAPGGPGRPGGQGPGIGGPGFGGPGFGGPAGGAGQGEAQYIRIRSLRIFTLEM